MTHLPKHYSFFDYYFPARPPPSGIPSTRCMLEASATQYKTESQNNTKEAPDLPE